MSAQRQLAVRAADAARDAHFLVFGVRPAVQHNQIVATPLALGQFAGADAGGVENFFGQFAEGFAGHIHAGERGVPVALPLGNAAGQTMHVAVAKPGQGAGGAFRRMVIASVVVHHHAHVVARGQAHDVHLQPAIRHRCGEKQPVALPLGDAACQAMHVAVAKPGQGAGGTFRRTVVAAVVVHHHAHVGARGQAHDVHLQPAIRHGRREKQMRLAVLPVFAHIQQGDLAAIVQPLFERVGINGCDGRG
ncbi:hypothetical protein D3C72_1550090 [compost metagenome]